MDEPVESGETPSAGLMKEKLYRCMDWLQKQNSDEPKKLALINKNDIQFIIHTNAERKNFLLKPVDENLTVPVGVDESAVEPKKVPIQYLRVHKLQMECEWQSCRWTFNNYEQFQKHVSGHISHVHYMQNDDQTVTYVCLWDVCGHKTKDSSEIVRHINYHAYHSKLLAVGFNGRATMQLERCKRDSKKRNLLPKVPEDHSCMWVGCSMKFNAIQNFYDHVLLHVKYADDFVCSWAGCGAKFPSRTRIASHVRSHTGERVIACYHCGQHFACNRKLRDHLLRQNVAPNSSHVCHMCGSVCASAYLLREHARQHVGVYACALCHMSAPSLAALALHVRYRHVAEQDARPFACKLCEYRAVTQLDLKKHVSRHNKRLKKESSDLSDEENSDMELKSKPAPRMYKCHICTKVSKVFTRGSKLTSHLVKVHGAQWAFGYSRFRYQLSEDGMYRLMTTRFESLEVCKKIMEDDEGEPKKLISNSLNFDLLETAEPTEVTPRQFQVTIKGAIDMKESRKKKSSVASKKIVPSNTVEITMCDVDEDGNIINKKIINSDVLYDDPNVKNS